MFFLMLAAVAAPAMATLPAHACPANATNRHSVNPKIIVQGGIQPNTNSVSPAIGPKQDDPAQPKPGAGSGTSLVAIGPKQDDPAQPKPSAESGQSMLTIGPKQDDPAQPGRGSVASMQSDCGLTPAPRPH
jgi:hypothetical protein